MSKAFFTHQAPINPRGYPLLSEAVKYKHKPLICQLFFNLELSADDEKRFLKFFKHQSLKAAVKEYWTIQSPKIMQYINTKLIVEHDRHLVLNLNYFCAIEVLAEIFLRTDKPNPNDFLIALADTKIRALVAPYYSERKELVRFLNAICGRSELLKFLETSEINSDIEDTLLMFNQHPKHMQTALQKHAYNNRNSFQKCHDLMSGENEKLAHKNFKLRQEAHCPALPTLANQSIKQYQLVVPESYHTLIEWGNKLSHCIGSRHYADNACQGRCLLLGLTDKNGEIKFTMEISNKNLVQIQGVSHSEPTPVVMKELRQILKKAKVLK